MGQRLVRLVIQRWFARLVVGACGAVVALFLVLGDLSAALGRIQVSDLPAHTLQSVDSRQEAREAWCVWHTPPALVEPAEAEPAAANTGTPAGAGAGPAADSPAGNSPAAEGAAEDSPTGGSAAEDSPTEDSPTGDSPAADGAVEDSPVGDGPVKDSAAALCVKAFDAGAPAGPPGAWTGAAEAIIGWYVALDALLMVLVIALALGLVLRRRPQLDCDTVAGRSLKEATGARWLWALLGSLALLEALRALALLVLRSPSAERGAVGAAGGALMVLTWARWIPLFLLALLLVCLAVHRYVLLPADRPAGAPDERGEALRRRGSVSKAVGLLRFQILAVVVFCAVLVLGREQLGDALLRWSDIRLDSVRGLVRGAAVAGAGTAATVLLALLVWRSSHRVALFGRTRAADPLPPWVPAVLAVASGVAAIWWRNLGGLAVVLGVIVVLSWINGANPFHRREPDDATGMVFGKSAARRNANLVSPEVRAVVLRLARWLAAVPVVMLAAAVLRAALPAAISLDSPRMWLLAGYGLVLLVVAAPAAAVVMEADDRLRRGKVEDAVTEHRLYWWLTAVAALAAIVAVTSPFSSRFPVLVGPVGTLALFLMAVLAWGTEAQRWAESTVPVAGLRALGATRNPVVAVLIVWVLVGSTLDRDGAHEVRLLHDPDAATAGSGLTVESAFDRWLTTNCAVGDAPGDARGDAPGDPPGEPVPMVFVATAGGGIRAAYWTAGVLDALFPAAPDSARAAGCPASGRDRVFALSGASGGSVGAMYWLTGEPADPASGGRPWYDAPLTADHLSNAASWMLYVDVPRVLFGYGGADRAAALERSWERSQPALINPFLAGYRDTTAWRPLALLNGAAVESGCRAVTAPVPLASLGDDGTVGCLRAAGGTSTSAYDLTTLYVCDDQDLRASTAALLSARFPYITPTGRLTRTRCHKGEQTPGTSTTYVVDGGYVDNSGAMSITDLYLRLRGAIERHNAFVDDCDASPECQALPADRRPARRIEPLLLRVDNGYASVARVTDPGRPRELVAPAVARSAAANAITSGAIQRAYQEFGAGSVLTVANAPHPGVEAPLGWVLSGAARDDLCAELRRVLREPALRYRLDGAGLPRPAPPSC